MDLTELIKSWKNKRFISLLSGGLDSPVATHLMMEKGYDCICITFLIGDDYQKSKEKMVKIVKRLKKLSNNKITLILFKHNDILEKFISKGKRKLTCILCKRYMLRVARYIAHQTDSIFIVNGDILGEQASQTLDNLVQVQKVIDDIAIIRPLIGFEKLEVINKSRELLLYELSILPESGCNYNPKYPETHARTSDIVESEKDIDYETLVQDIVKDGELILF